MENQTQEQRRQPRYAIDVTVNVHSRIGTIRGHVVEMSESGISAHLEAELQVGEQVELEIRLPFAFSGSSTLAATLKHRTGLRHGFEFVYLDLAQSLASGSRDAIGNIRILLLLSYIAGYSAGRSAAHPHLH